LRGEGAATPEKIATFAVPKGKGLPVNIDTDSYGRN
jgi:hypothetical protein